MFKDGDKTDVCCYRTMSLLCSVSKVLAKLIFDPFYFFVKVNLHSSQFGFRKHQSTVLQILIFLDKIYKTTDSETGKNLAVLYLDFSKPFDKVCHKRLPKKLARHGVGGNFLKLPHTYLTNRQQLVQNNTARSSLKAVSSDVPQDSV